MSSQNAAKFSSTVNIIENETYTSNISLDSHNGDEKAPEETADDYDPYQHRTVKHPLSDARAVANLIKSSMGTGILAVPAAFKNSGYIFGAFGTVIVGYICAHAYHMVVATSRGICKELKVPALGYAETCEAVFKTGPKRLRRLSTIAKILTEWALASTYLGACSVYFVILSASLQDILNAFYPKLDIATQFYSIVFLIPLMFLVQIKNLKFLAPFSAIANVLMVTVFAICFYYIVIDFPTIEGNTSIRSTSDVTRLPLFFTTMLYAMEGIGVIMPLENEMAQPQHFLGCPGVLYVSMTFIIFMYGTLGLLGYLRYGDNVKGSITLNLPRDALPALLGKAFIILAIFLTFLLQFYVPAMVLWKYVKNSVSAKRQTFWQIILRLACLFGTVAIGLLIPKIEQIIGLVGAIFDSFLGLIIPATIAIVFAWDRDLGKYKWKLWKNSLLLALGLIALICGSIQSIKELFGKNNN